MRITINTDDKGKVHIDTGDAGDVRPDIKPGLFESTPDVPVIDAGAAPVQEIERMQHATAGEAGKTLSATAAAVSDEERESQLPLNPLRAGAAAAYRDPANLRKRAADVEGTFAVAQQQQPSAATFDGGAAQVAEREEVIGASTPARQASKQQSSKRAKRDKRR
jgi:hypothetical protein